jgi:hypothetical protein
MIASNIGASDVEVIIRKDHAYGWLWLRESGTYVKLTEAGATLLA